MKKHLPIILCFVVGFLLGFYLDRRAHRKPAEPTIIRDTVSYTIIDTFVVEKPVIRTSYIYDTVRTYFTTIEHDTVLVNVPIERKVYAEDSLYYASVSGWKPSLDTLIVYPKETTITITNTVKTPPPRFTLGVTAGPSILLLPHGEIKGGFGLTAGVSYNF